MKYIIMFSLLFLTACTEPGVEYIRSMKYCLILNNNAPPEVIYDINGWSVNCKEGIRFNTTRFNTKHRLTQPQLIRFIKNSDAQEYGYEITLCEQWNAAINNAKEKSK